jgi:hypothetical protein
LNDACVSEPEEHGGYLDFVSFGSASKSARSAPV